jgi:Methyltransferase domain
VKITPSFEQLVAEYQNTAEHNDCLYNQLTDLTWAEPILSAHRRYVEQEKLGYGDAAFHAMWLRLMDFVHRRFGTVRTLEIGVFKGQVISLWALIELAGQPMPRSGLIRALRFRFDPRFRECLHNGNFYPDDDYAKFIRQLFEHFDLKFDNLDLHHGYSTEQHILNRVADSVFHVVYVDGDHTFDGALHDFTTFGAKVVVGGLLVADDASFSLPGSVFWKGHESVSRAANVLPDIGFRNVMNVGHNRIYERVG